MINYMKTKSGRPLSIIGLTATASFDVLADVERELTLGGNLTIDSETIVRPENDSRPELTYRIINVESDFDSIRDENIPCILKVNDDWAIKDVVAESKKRRMLQLIHEIPIDLQDINCDNSSDASCYIEDYSTASFYNYNDENAYDNAGIILGQLINEAKKIERNITGAQAANYLLQKRRISQEFRLFYIELPLLRQYIEFLQRTYRV